MKKIMMAAAFMLVSGLLMAQEKTTDIKVWGNCGMCKKRIEKTAMMDGVSAATWDKETKMLTLTYDAAKVDTDAVAKKIASVGHDTEKYRADDKTYEGLPECCLYDRKAKSKKDN